MSLRKALQNQGIHFSSRTLAVIAASVILLSLLALPGPARATSHSNLSIVGQDQNGNPITGFGVSIAGPSGNSTAISAPASYSLNSNWLYTVQVQTSNACTFAYWAGLGSAGNPLHLSIMGPLQLVAVFNCGGSPTSVTVVSQMIGGQTIAGYDTVTYNSNGNIMSTGFTPKTYGAMPGNTYWVLADSYGSCAFSHWSDGTTANPRSVSVYNQPILLTAVYMCA